MGTNANDEVKRPRKTVALITGATSGIGLELAKLFAKQDHEIIIVGHHKDRLHDTVAILRGLGAHRVHPIHSDLMRPEGPQAVIEAVSQLGSQVDVLVNDAGVGEFGLFETTSLQRELDIIQLNICSLVALTKYFLPLMLDRGEGRILNLASVASYQPTPKLAVYAATKAFVLNFTDGIRHEVKDRGVTITALIPGPTDTDFFRKARMEHTVAANEKPEDPAVVAKAGWDALFNDEAHGYAPGSRKQAAMSSVNNNERIAAMAARQMEPHQKKED